jgi:hypothetical protein
MPGRRSGRMAKSHELDPDQKRLRERHRQLRGIRPPPENHQPPPSIDLLSVLADSGYQRGLGWRQAKIAAIREIVKQGKTVPWVAWYLKHHAGMVVTTANRMIADALEPEPGTHQSQPNPLLPDIRGSQRHPAKVVPIRLRRLQTRRTQLYKTWNQHIPPMLPVPDRVRDPV